MPNLEEQPMEEQPDIPTSGELPNEAAQPELEIPMLPAITEWDNAAEQEWNEHSTTAWALAHVIHRICSTPMPPILPPEQRRHFQKVVHMAAALMEEWQRRERDLAQQLVAQHPFAPTAGELLTERQTTDDAQPEEPDQTAAGTEDQPAAQTVAAGTEQE